MFRYQCHLVKLEDLSLDLKGKYTYANEEQVGRAIAESGVAREDLFLVTKVWMNHGDEEGVAKSIDESLRKLQTDYVDLLLVHHPYGDYYSIYRAMEKAYEQGKARAIGLSNFYDARFTDLVYHTGVVPAVNQLETNVFSQQDGMREQLAESDTRLMAWGLIIFYPKIFSETDFDLLFNFSVSPRTPRLQ